MQKPKYKRTVIAVRFTPGEEQQTQVIDTGTILENFKEHCKKKGLQYSRKAIELCQVAMKTKLTGEALKTLVREEGVGLTGLKIGAFIKTLIIRYMNELKEKEKWTKEK